MPCVQKELQYSAYALLMDFREFWEKILGEAELQVSRPNFITWLKNSELMDKRDGVALISFPNNFAKEWAENKLHKMLLALLRSHDENIKRIEYLVRPKEIKAAPPLEDSGESPQLAFMDLRIDPETNLNPRYTMQSFVVGSSNEMAHAAATEVIQEVGKKYNPLFIYGGVGVGKTHLIQAIGGEICRLHPSRVRVRYVPSEKFTNEVVWAMRNKRMDTVKERYRGVDVLIIDDIQFIGGKARTEEEFFHTFNALYENNKQIIVSSDRSPRFLPTLSERLRSRFEGGMTCDISAPDYELRVAVLQSKLRARGASLAQPLVEFLALRAPRNLRDLEGLVNRILFSLQTQRSEPASKVVERLVQESVQSAAHSVAPSEIIAAVASFFELSPQEIIGRSRRREVVEPRQIAVFLLKDFLNLSYVSIGKKIGARDHTTAIYAYDKIKNQLSKDRVLNNKVMTIRETIQKS